MTVVKPAVYRFFTAQHWERCLLHRLDVNDGLAGVRRLLSRAAPVGPEGSVDNVATTPGGIAVARLPRGAASAGSALFQIADQDRVVGPFEIDGSLASSPRWVVDREWIWAFAPDATTIERYERDTLQRDRAIDAAMPIVDAAPDGKQGVWVLLRQSSGTFELLHIDCRGCVRERLSVPCEVCAPTRLGTIERGRRLVLLTAHGRRLVFVSPATAKVERVLSIGTLAACWSARHLATDGRARIALWGEARFEHAPARGISFVLDASGDVLDGPIDDAGIFATAGDAPSSSAPPEVLAIAVSKSALWFATSRRLWRLGAAVGNSAADTDSSLLTPALVSPDTNPVRGWLRAEVFADLPRGSVLEAEFASTDRPEIAAQAGVLADDRSTTTSQRQEAIWQLLEHSDRQRFRFTSVPASGEPLAIPLFESRDRWLWLRLMLTVPPGPAAGKITELRVYYPGLSIAQHLPAAFLGGRKDPTGTMRRLVGVLESTTQRIDERIRSIGSFIDPATAPDHWLDYLGRWLDLPWDDELPNTVKREVLQVAGTLLDRRGTRGGIAALLRALLGVEANVRIEDLTVDHAAAVIGGGGRVAGPALPTLLGGAPLRAPALGERAVLGRVCLAQPGDAALDDPFDVIEPTVGVDITAAAGARRIAPLLPRILAQYVPAGVRVRIRWHNQPFASALDDAHPLELDGQGPGRLGRDSAIGRTVLEGRKGRLSGAGIDVGFTVQ